MGVGDGVCVCMYKTKNNLNFHWLFSGTYEFMRGGLSWESAAASDIGSGLCAALANYS